MAGVLGIGGDLHAWTPRQLDTARRMVAHYKEVRAAVQLGEQYRLGGEPGRQLSAVQYVYGDAVVVLLYRPQAGVRPDPGALRLAGLDLDAHYLELDPEDRAPLADPPGGGAPASGRVLMSVGLPIRDRLPAGDWASALVRLRRLP